MKKILTIAGSDTSGGAGIQADLRTFAKHNLYGMNVLTVVVTMDPYNSWAHEVFPVGIVAIEKQLQTALVGVGADAVKTGMLPTVEIINLVASYLEKVKDKLPVVIDPVMVCKGDKPLFPENAIAIKEKLLPCATITTPNLFEAAQLAGLDELKSFDDAKFAADKILNAGAKAVIIKGVGSLLSPKTAADLYADKNGTELIEKPLINTEHTHGLGCTFAAHIASNICKGHTPKEACHIAKDAMHKGLLASWAINKYVGTLSFDKSFE